ncbi:hypothetical protein AB0F20_29690 [Streptomyces goshikiensis]|uniref:hypothetical protein n=1 Tax=Streptomyces goshikiensis TaxID=1942 RepID=UPI0033F49C71
MEYFTLSAASAGQDPAAIHAALREAWNACAGVPCGKCCVPEGQYCRDRARGAWYVTRFHRPRQDAADLPGLLGPLGIHGLSWAKGTGWFVWDDRRVPSAG